MFEGYERQYCELSVNLSKKCSSAALLPIGGINSICDLRLLSGNLLAFQCVPFVDLHSKSL